MGTRVPSCGKKSKLYIRYFVQIMEINLKIKILTKVGTDDEIDEKDAAISSDYFLLKILGGKFRQISRCLGFPEGNFKLFLAHSLPFFS